MIRSIQYASELGRTPFMRSFLQLQHRLCGANAKGFSATLLNNASLFSAASKNAGDKSRANIILVSDICYWLSLLDFTRSSTSLH